MSDETQTDVVDESAPVVERPVPPGMKVFGASVTSSESVKAGEDVELPFERERPGLPPKWVKFEAPDTSHLILMSALLEGAKDDKRQAEILINWFFQMMEPSDRRYFQARLFDSKDKFDLGIIAEVIDELMGRWSDGRPTQRSSASSDSPKTAGKKSPAKRHGKGGPHSGRTPSRSGAASSTGGRSAASAPKAARSSGT